MKMGKKVIATFLATVMLSCCFALNSLAYGNISDTSFTFAVLDDEVDLTPLRPKWDNSWVYIKCTYAEYQFSATPAASFWRTVGTKWAYTPCGNTYTIYQGSTRWMINYIYENYGYNQDTIIEAVGIQRPNYYVAQGVWSPDSV